MYTAAADGDVESLQQCIEVATMKHGVDCAELSPYNVVTQTDEVGFTPLHYAAFQGQEKAATLLVEVCGAPVCGSPAEHKPVIAACLLFELATYRWTARTMSGIHHYIKLLKVVMLLWCSSC